MAIVLKQNDLMKKFGMIVSLSVFAGSSVFGQSQFLFRNFEPGYVDAPVFNAQGNPLEGAVYMAELWGGTTIDSLTPLVILRQPYPREILPFALDGYVALSNNGPLIVPTAIPGGAAWLQMRAWDARLGDTYEEVSALGFGGYGESSVFYVQGTDPTLVPPVAPAPLIGLQSFSLRPIIPEPSAWALLALGGITVWLTRRKQTG